MSSLVQRLNKKKLISPPKFLITSVQMEVIMGCISVGENEGTVAVRKLNQIQDLLNE